MNMQRLKSAIGLWMTYAFLLIMMVISVYPILWVIGSSLNPGTSLFSSTLIPKHATFDHYVWLFTSPDSQYLIWYKNTLIIATLNVIVSVILTMGTAYAFSRYRFVGRKHGLTLFLSLQMFPSMMTMVAIYVLLNMLDLQETGISVVHQDFVIPGGDVLVRVYAVRNVGLEALPVHFLHYTSFALAEHPLYNTVTFDWDTDAIVHFRHEHAFAVGAERLCTGYQAGHAKVAAVENRLNGTNIDMARDDNRVRR